MVKMRSMRTKQAGSACTSWRERLSFLAALTCAGVVAGLTAVVMIFFLHACVWLFFGQWNESFMEALSAASPLRRTLAVPIGGLLAACAWALLRRSGAVLSVAGLLDNVIRYGEKHHGAHREKACDKAGVTSDGTDHSTSIGSSKAQSVPIAAGVAQQMLLVAYRPHEDLHPQPSDTSPVQAPQEEQASPRQLWKMIGCAFVQVAAVGAGNSIGRENAPRQMAAALAYWVGKLLSLNAADLRLVVAAAAGAALAGVYNTPLAAIAFTAGITLRKWSWRTCLATAWVAAIATPIAWVANHNLPSMPFHASVSELATVAKSQSDSAMRVLQPVAEFLTSSHGWSVIALCLALAIVCALAGVLMAALCSYATRRARARFGVISDAKTFIQMLIAMLSASTLTALAALWAPQILGNGKNTLDIAYGNAPALVGVSIGVAVFVACVKPLVTSVSLASGMIGGLLMPSCAVGGSIGVAWSLLACYADVHVPFALAALLGAACVLAVTQKCGIFAWVFLLELAHAPVWVWPIAGGVVTCAVGVARLLCRARGKRHATRL